MKYSPKLKSSLVASNNSSNLIDEGISSPATSALTYENPGTSNVLVPITDPPSATALHVASDTPQENDAEDVEIDVRRGITFICDLYASEAENIAERSSVDKEYAANLIFDIKSNEKGGWLVIGMLAYKTLENTFCYPGGAGNSVEADEGRKNAMIDLAAACRNKGVKITWQTLYELARRVRVLLEVPLAELGLTDSIQIKEARAKAIVELLGVSSNFAKIASKAANPVASLKMLVDPSQVFAKTLEPDSAESFPPEPSLFERTVCEVAVKRGLKPSCVLEDFLRLQSSTNYDLKSAYKDLGLPK